MKKTINNEKDIKIEALTAVSVLPYAMQCYIVGYARGQREAKVKAKE